MVISKELNNKLHDLVVDYKCLCAYSSVEEMAQYMDYNSDTFKKVCNYMHDNEVMFRAAQKAILESLRGEITYIIINELYENV